MVVGIIVIGVIGYLSNAIFDSLEQRVMPWSPLTIVSDRS
jgi:ABC-type nitrate/sulfonate/bicarbonate transport system permease component